MQSRQIDRRIAGIVRLEFPSQLFRDGLLPVRASFCHSLIVSQMFQADAPTSPSYRGRVQGGGSLSFPFR